MCTRRYNVQRTCRYSNVLVVTMCTCNSATWLLMLFTLLTVFTKQILVVLTFESALALASIKFIFN